VEPLCVSSAQLLKPVRWNKQTRDVDGVITDRKFALLTTEGIGDARSYPRTTRQRLIIELQLDASIIADQRNPDRSDRIKGRTQRMNDLSDFYETSKKLFGPYIQAHQKVGIWSADAIEQ